jgi:hypothetical protein
LLKFLLILALAYQPTIALAESPTADPKASPAYADAVVLGTCSGLYNFLAIVYKMQRNRTNVKNALAESQLWRVSTKGALYEAGFGRIKVIVNSDSLIEAEQERMQALMAVTPKHVTTDLNAGLKTCQENVPMHEKYTKLMEARAK